MLPPEKRGNNMSASVEKEKHLFLRKKSEAYRIAAQQIALQLICGIDLQTLLNEGGIQKNIAAIRLHRLIERERLKGLRQHWSYDLNRHIALKQVLDMINV